LKIKRRRGKWNTKVMDEEKFLIQALWIQKRYKEFLLDIYDIYLFTLMTTK